MSVLGAAAITGAAGLGAAKMGTSSAKAVNEEMMDFAKNKHQYNMADLEKAGLNPLLSATQGSSAASVPKLENPSNAAIQAASGAASVGQAIAQTKLINEQARGAQITNDLEEHKKGTYEKGWSILDGVTDWLLDHGQSIANSARSVGTGAGNVSNAEKDKPLELEMRPKISSVADEKPRLWDPDYKQKMKTWNYLQSLNK